MMLLSNCCRDYTLSSSLYQAWVCSNKLPCVCSHVYIRQTGAFVPLHPIFVRVSAYIRRCTSVCVVYSFVGEALQDYCGYQTPILPFPSFATSLCPNRLKRMMRTKTNRVQRMISDVCASIGASLTT